MESSTALVNGLNIVQSAPSYLIVEILDAPMRFSNNHGTENSSDIQQLVGFVLKVTPTRK